MVDTAETAAVLDGLVFFGSRNCEMYALHASNGSVAWHAKQHGVLDLSSPTVGATPRPDGRLQGTVFFGTDPTSQNSSVVALGGADGVEVWMRAAPTTGIGSAPVLSPDGRVVYIGVPMSESTSGGMWALSTSTGALLWEYSTASFRRNGLQGNPAVSSNGVLVFGACDCTVTALNASDGVPLRALSTSTGVGLGQCRGCL